MNGNRKIGSHKKAIKMMTGTLSLAMAGGLLAGCNSRVDEEALQEPSSYPEESGSINNTKELEENVSRLLGEATGVENQGKEETVYLFADSSGHVKSTIVSSWLKNPEGQKVLVDETTLQEVANVKGNEPYSREKQQYVWKAEGKDIYYQGVTQKQAPVTEKITYFLDGKEVEPKQLAGKSGKVRIRFDYENHSEKTVSVNGRNEQIKTPFVVLTGMILQENFKNVEATNAKLLSDGKNTVVVGYAMPGLKESLQLEDAEVEKEIEIPAYVEITADVTDFAMDMTLTVISSSQDLSFEDALDFSDLDEKIDTLSDSSLQLVDGTGELSEGVAALKDGVGEFEKGVASLENGIVEYTDGAAKLGDGILEIGSGSESLDDGMGQLQNGILSAKAGAGKLQDGAAQLKAGFEGERGAVSGAKQVAQGVEQARQAMNGLVNQMPSMVNAMLLQTKIDVVGQAMAQINPGVQVTAQNVDACVANYVRPALAQLEQSLQAALGGVQQAGYQEGYRAAVEDGVMTMQLEEEKEAAKKSAEEAAIVESEAEDSEATEEIGTEETEGEETETGSQDTDMGTGTDETEGAESIPDEDRNCSQEEQENSENGSDDAVGEVGNADEECATYSLDQNGMGIDQSPQADGRAGAQEVSALVEKIASLKGALAIVDQLNAKMQNPGSVLPASQMDAIKAKVQEMDALAAGASQLAGGVEALYQGTCQLAGGTGEMAEGLTALESGGNALKEGSQRLREGAGQLKDGALTLTGNSGKLIDGAGLLTQGTKDLTSGAGQLQDGVKKLQEGMIKFDEEGIQKIADAYNGDVKDLSERVKAVSEAGRDYDTFTGKSANMEGSVKFILKTEAIR